MESSFAGCSVEESVAAEVLDSLLLEQLLAGLSLVGFLQSENRHRFTALSDSIQKSFAIPAHDLEKARNGKPFPFLG
jgi:hypothetical protein